LIGASVGAMFLPWLIGQLFESVGPTVTMVTILIDVILSLGVLVVLLAAFNRPLKTGKTGDWRLELGD